VLYLDSCLLVKAYLDEEGSDVVRERLRSEERVFTSALSYAEVHAAIARKFQAEELTRGSFEAARDAFTMDWLTGPTILPLDAKILSMIPNLVEQHRHLRASDAVHLASGLWVRDTVRLSPEFASGEVQMEFGSADKALCRVAAQCGLPVFNPEAAA
jgi:predicted nucleic acid-binding protein